MEGDVVKEHTPTPHWSPYVAGFGLGVTLLLAFWTLGTGLGASGGIARLAAYLQHCVAPSRTEASAYFGPWFAPGSPHVLSYYLVYMSMGVLLGGFISAAGSGRLQSTFERGPRISVAGRAGLALMGGIVVGFATRLARGCTSGQALTGTALLFTGSLVFLICTFAGAYGAAWFVRRQWL